MSQASFWPQSLQFGKAWMGHDEANSMPPEQFQMGAHHLAEDRGCSAEQHEDRGEAEPEENCGESHVATRRALAFPRDFFDRRAGDEGEIGRHQRQNAGTEKGGAGPQTLRGMVPRGILQVKAFSGKVFWCNRKGLIMAGTRKKVPIDYRRRMKKRGFIRVYVQVREEDAPLLRRVAAALADSDRVFEARALLREHFRPSAAKGLKALLADAPLDEIDLVRSSDAGRILDAR